MAKKTSVTQKKGAGKKAAKKAIKKPAAKKKSTAAMVLTAGPIASITISKINGVSAESVSSLDHTVANTVTGFCNGAPIGILGHLYNDANTPASVAATALGAHSWSVTFPANYVTVAGEYVLEVYFGSGTGVSDSMVVTVT